MLSEFHFEDFNSKNISYTSVYARSPRSSDWRVQLTAFNLLFCPSKLWEIPFDESEHQTKSGVLAFRPASLRRGLNQWRLVPHGIYRHHGSLGVSGVKRGNITEFSRKSQSRLESVVNEYNVQWNSFITLTFHVPYLQPLDRDKPLESDVTSWSADSLKSDKLNILHCNASRKLSDGSLEYDSGQDIRLAFSLMRAWVRTVTESAKFRDSLIPPLFVWKKEFTSRGVIHFHLLSTARLKKHIRGLQKRWAELTQDDENLNSCDIQIPKNKKMCAWYLAKYVSKHDKENNGFCCSAPLGLCFNFLGRWWGIINRSAWAKARHSETVFPLHTATYKKLFRRFLLHIRNESSRQWLKKHRTLEGFVPPFQNLSKDDYICLKCFRSEQFDNIIVESILNPDNSIGLWGFYDDVVEKDRLLDMAVPFNYDTVLADSLSDEVG